MKINEINKEYAAVLRFRLQQDQHSVQQQRSSSNSKVQHSSGNSEIGAQQQQKQQNSNKRVPTTGVH